MTKSNYWVNQIKKLDKREAVRKKLWMYIWTNDSRWYHHLFYEILSNSIDEVINWYATDIIVRLIDKQTIEIEDNWRWIPFWKNKDKIEVLEMIFSELHSGWKMDNTKWDWWYKFSGWTNGVWTSVTNFISTFMNITSIREWKIAELNFINGETKWTIIKSHTWKKKNGTIVRFCPDLELFPWVKWFSVETLKKVIQDQVYLQKMKIIFEDFVHDETYIYENTEGLSKYITDYNNLSISEIKDSENDEDIDNENWENEWIKVKKLITPIASIFTNENIECKWPNNQYVLIDYSLEFIREEKEYIKGYTNSINNPDWWEHIKGFKNGVYLGIKKILEKWNQADQKMATEILPTDIHWAIVWLISVKMPDPTFEGQTKNKLNDDYIRKLVSAELIKDLQKKVTEDDLKDIRKVLENRISLRKKIDEENAKLEKIDNERDLEKKLRSKLKDATSKDRTKTELYIVEWDSAWWTLKSTRDIMTQAIMPLKWKPINVFNNTSTKIFANQEINNMIYAISWWYIWKDFNITKHLRYGKLIVAADADDDGLHIVLLTLSFLLKFYPELIDKGYVYISVSPLFACKYKEDTKYFYTTKAQEQFIRTKEWQKYTVNRFKWLWEFKADDGYKFLMSTRTRKLQNVITNDIQQSIDWFSNLMGDDSQFKFDLFNSYIHEMLEKIDNDTLWLENKEKHIIDIWKDNSTIYNLQVNKERAIPAIDGLKDVTRRVLYTLKHNIKSKSDWNYVKSATVVGATMWAYHPHWDTSIYDAAVWILKDYWNTHPLIDGQWNWGTADWDWSAAMRYTEMKIAKVTEDYYMDWIYKNAVDFRPNFDNTKEEPNILPCKIPFVLLNDNFWIGYGKMTNSMIPHNIREVLQATLAFLNKKKDEKIDPLDYIKWPDVVVWNTLLNSKKEIRDIYNNPKWWAFTFRVPIYIRKSNWQKVLEILEYPYRNYNFEKELVKIQKAIDDKKILWVKSVIERSWVDKATNKKWFRLYFTIDQKINTNLIIESIYKETIFERKIPYTPLFLNRERELKYFTLSELIQEFIDFRRETILRVTQFEIEKIDDEFPSLYAKWLQALNIDEIVKILKTSKNRKDAKEKIIKKFNNKIVFKKKIELTDDMADVILDTKLWNIMDLQSLEDTILKKQKERDKLQDIIDKPLVLKKLMIKETEDILNIYKNEKRRTKLYLEKDIKEIIETKEKLSIHYKELKEAEKYYNNLLIVDNDDFIQKIPLQTEAKLKEKLEQFYKEKSIKDWVINQNKGKLYIYNDDNSWYNIAFEKIKDKTKFTPNLLIKQFFWDPIAFVFDNEDDKSSWKEVYSIIYIDTKNKVWGYNIKKSDLVKNRQGYKLWKNKIVYIGKSGWILKLKDIKGIRTWNPIYKKDTVDTSKLPTKKSTSSGVLI